MCSGFCLSRKWNFHITGWFVSGNAEVFRGIYVSALLWHHGCFCTGIGLVVMMLLVQLIWAWTTSRQLERTPRERVSLALSFAFETSLTPVSWKNSVWVDWSAPCMCQCLHELKLFFLFDLMVRSAWINTHSLSNGESGSFIILWVWRGWLHGAYLYLIFSSFICFDITNRNLLLYCGCLARVYSSKWMLYFSHKLVSVCFYHACFQRYRWRRLRYSGGFVVVFVLLSASSYHC